MKKVVIKQNIPVNVVTGFLGSGKTTIILNLVKQLPNDYKVVWLKNEYGNINIDSELAKENNIQTTEIMNGCVCCVLIGRLRDALEQIIKQYSPDRIIIESSGTAYPLPIVREINRITSLLLDGVVNVIDAENFAGYTDKGYVAKLQNEVVDLVIINKTGQVSSDRIDWILDQVYELNPNVNVVKTADGVVSSALVIGLDPHLDISSELGGNGKPYSAHKHEDGVDAVEFITQSTYSREQIDHLLSGLEHKGFIRIKGVVNISDQCGTHPYLLSWVFGKTSWQELSKYKGDTKVVFLGKDINTYKDHLKQKLNMV